MAKQRSSGRTLRTQSAHNPSGAVHPTGFLLAWALCGLGLQRIVPLTLPLLPDLGFLGKSMALMGVLLFAWAGLEFRRYKTTLQHRRATTSLIVSGPFRLTRNPIYVALALVLLGMGVEYGNPWWLMLTVPFVVALHWFTILPEEAYLERVFGDEYRSYSSHVNRWIGRAAVGVRTGRNPQRTKEG